MKTLTNLNIKSIIFCLLIINTNRLWLKNSQDRRHSVHCSKEALVYNIICNCFFSRAATRRHEYRKN